MLTAVIEAGLPDLRRFVELAAQAVEAGDFYTEDAVIGDVSAGSGNNVDDMMAFLSPGLERVVVIQRAISTAELGSSAILASCAGRGVVDVSELGAEDHRLEHEGKSRRSRMVLDRVFLGLRRSAHLGDVT
jgi:hypothetical protein